MRRRELLGGISCALLAGCVTFSDDGDSDVQESTGGSGGQDSGGGGDTSQDLLNVADTELIHSGEGEDSQVRVEGTVENVADRALGQVVATATFMEGDTLLGGWVGTVNGMESGETWIVSIRSGDTSGADARAVDDVRFEVEERTGPDDLGTDGVEIVESGLVQEDGFASVEGVGENVTDDRLEYVEVAATFTDGGDTLLGRALVDVLRDVDSGQQFEFSITYGSSVRDDESVGGYQLTNEGRPE